MASEQSETSSGQTESEETQADFIQQFTGVTGTEESLAKLYLEKTNWNVLVRFSQAIFWASLVIPFFWKSVVLALFLYRARVCVLAASGGLRTKISFIVQKTLRGPETIVD